jgi:catechol 2,3-dioxygenase-like lactoylglutathione lyase family enzyme
MNLNQITIPSINVEKATAFYKLLGLQLIVDALPRYVRFECPVGDTTFSIHKVNELPKGDGTIVYFENDNLDEHVQKLIDKGVQFEELPNDKSWLWREAKLRDTDNNQIIIFQAGKNRKSPPWRIKDKQK